MKQQQHLNSLIFMVILLLFIDKAWYNAKYTFYVHYPNNNYWGSAFGFYYYESGCIPGDLNGDSQTNVQDIVALVNLILSIELKFNYVELFNIYCINI